MKDKTVFLMARRYGRNPMLRFVRATGDDALTLEQHRALFEGGISLAARDCESIKMADECHH